MADSYDRRKLMMTLDISAGIVTVGFLMVLTRVSLFLLYAVPFMQSAIEAIYYLATIEMVRLIVPELDDLKLAVTMNSWAWSVMALFGGILAGSAIEYIGLSAFFVADTVSFFFSTAFMTKVCGDYSVTKQSERPERRNSVNSAKAFVMYIWTCKFAFLVFMKASGALIWGPEDILGVAYATVDGNEDETSHGMVVLFSCIGLGCLIGVHRRNKT